MSKKSVASQENGIRVIKKYPNRRLYDTATSAYVVLADIKQLVMRHTPFVVRDVKTGDDLTRSILLQIILEEEAAGMPLLSERMLANIIRFYGHAMQGDMGIYLENSVQTLIELQEKLAANARDLPLVTDLMNNYNLSAQQGFQELQEQLQKQLHQHTQHMLDAIGLTFPHGKASDKSNG